MNSAKPLDFDALDRLVHVGRFGLVSDVDGTISPLAPTPQAAGVAPRCRAALERLAACLPLVAIVSGRMAADVSRIVGLDGVVYVGNHGLERWDRGHVVTNPAAESYRAALARALETLRDTLALPGLVFEDKGLVVGVHYRLAGSQRRARAAVLSAAEAVAKPAGLVVAEGKRVVELRPPVGIDKGTAVADLVAEHRLDSVLFAGDDRTDVTAFRQIRHLRQSRACRGFSIAVCSEETPLIVVRAADATVGGVDGMAEVLEFLALKCDQIAKMATVGND